MPDVRLRTSHQIVERQNFPTFRDQPVAKMRPQEAGPSRDYRTHSSPHNKESLGKTERVSVACAPLHWLSARSQPNDADTYEMATLPDNRASAPPRRTRCWKLAAIVAAVFLFLVLVVLFGVGRWLVVDDSLRPAQSIVVLSGAMPVRAIEAAKLYRQGAAPAVWLTRGEEPAASLKAMDIPYVGEDFYNLRILVHEGVPPEAIHILPKPIVNTVDEILAISKELNPGSPVIIVTSKVHTRRVRVLWHKLASARGEAIVRSASDDPFDPQHWWRSTTDALDVVREVLGLLNAWSGFLLPPGKPS